MSENTRNKTQGVRPVIYVIVLNWLGWKDTIRAVESVLKSAEVEIRLVLVENGSPNDSADRLREHLTEQAGQSAKALGPFRYEFSGQTAQGSIEEIGSFFLLTNQKNDGFAGGCNVGIHFSISKGASSVFLLNSDAGVAENTLKLLADIAQKTEAPILGTRVLNQEDSTDSFLGADWYLWLLSLGQLRLSKYLPKPYAEYWESDLINGCAMYLKSSFLGQRYDSQGFYFDPKYFLYHEETDLCLFSRSVGHSSPVISRDAVVVHGISKSSGGKGNPRTGYYTSRNLVLLARTWLSGFVFVCFILWYFMAFSILSALRLILRGPSRWTLVKAQIIGIWDGMTGVHGQKDFIWIERSKK